MRGWPIHGALILVLTLLSQVGGLIYAGALWGRRFVPLAATRAGFVALFVLLYAAAWLPIERLAALTGREGLPCVARDGLAASAFSCALHRHYVKPQLAGVAATLAHDVAERFPGTMTRTLDGNFPFFDGVPLPPHLSHDDGGKLDLAFYYQRDGAYRPGALGSPIGYWKFERPQAGETEPCGDRTGGMRWEMGWFSPLTDRSLSLEAERTRFALRWLTRNGAAAGVGKVFVEPHLARRLGARGDVIRFQGCRSARHDDHIHIQLR